ncbi:LysR family transcriptional regulator [Vibrio sp. WXL103]
MRLLDDFYIFCKVVELGSMKKASEQLEIPLSTVSRRISGLEAHVGSQLFIRSKTSLKPSNEGTSYYQRLSPHYHNLAEEIDNIQRDESDIAGKVTIDCTPLVYNTFLAPTVTRLLKQYPKLKIKFIPAVDTSVLHPDADLGFMVGDLQDSSLVAKKLLDFRVKAVVAKSLAQEVGVVTTLSELKKHNFIGHLQHSSLSGYNRDTDQMDSVNLYPKVVLVDAPGVVEMTRSGIGFSVVSEYYAEPYLASGEFVEWLPNYDLGSYGMHLVYRHRVLKSNAQKVVMVAFEEAFKALEIG